MGKKVRYNKKLDQPYVILAIGVALIFVVYLLFLLATDSGSIFQYFSMFVALYYGIHFLKKFVKVQFFNNDKTRKTRRVSR